MIRGSLARVSWRFVRFVSGLALSSVVGMAAANTPDDEAYEQAQASIRAQDWQDAIDRLEALRRAYPQHAGALLDLAILYCNIGNTAKADAALDVLERTFELPPRLAPLIRELRLRRCARADKGTQWSAIFAVGRETNANQGSATRSFSLGSSTAPLYVTLDDEFLPQASTFAAVQLQISRRQNVRDRLYGALHARRYASVAGFDDAIALLGYERSLSDASGSGSADVNASLRTLGGKLYQQTLSAGLQALPRWAQQPHLMFGLDIRTAHAHFPTRTAFDSWETAISAPLLWQPSARTSTRASVGWLVDIALDRRPGGDRMGPTMSVDWAHQPTHDWKVYASWNARLLQGESPYAPPLLAMSQRQRRHVLTSGWEMQLSRQDSFRIEYQHTRNVDTVPMYRFNGESLVFYWVREGGR